ncbi:hypothetical protein M0802_008810 [Mischocyttarus mexicanus]|nr:hypothetical protein M0802_008810 [Mischocyttarus mexicanus]
MKTRIVLCQQYDSYGPWQPCPSSLILGPMPRKQPIDDDSSAFCRRVAHSKEKDKDDDDDDGDDEEEEDTKRCNYYSPHISMIV